MSTIEIEEFMNGALISWIKSCLSRDEVFVGYESLLDGTMLHSVYLQIDHKPQYHPVELKNAENSGLSSVRLRNFDAIVRNLRNLYDGELGRTILDLPDSTILGHAPESLGGLEQMKLLITLLLGAAMQCTNKEIFITRINELDVNAQQVIAEVIKEVNDSKTLVLTQETVNQLTTDEWCKHIMRLAKERDQCHSKWMSSVILQNESMNSTNPESSNLPSSATNTPSTSSKNNHLVDYESELQKLRHKLEEKSELLIELKEGLHQKCTEYEKLRSESQEAMKAAAYRDEVNALNERSDAEFYRTKIEELQEYNRMLLEAKTTLEEKLRRSSKCTDQVATLEADIIRFKQTLDEKNVQLELVNNDVSLSEQLASNAQSRVMNLELENRRILEELESLKESSSNKILELETDKKRLSLQHEQLQENCSLLTQEKRVLEGDIKNALEEIQKLHDTLDAKHVTIDKQNQDRNLDRMRQTELERQIESLTKEKQHVVNLCDSIQRRATDLEYLFESKTKEVQQLDEVLEFVSMEKKSYEVEWEKKVLAMEKENHELLSKAKILDETITALKKDLYNGTLAKKQVEQNLKRLGLNEIDLENNDMNLKLFVEKLCQNPESLRIIKEIVRCYQQEVYPAGNFVKLETATPSEAELDELQTENTSLRSQSLQSNVKTQEKFIKEGSSFTESSLQQADPDTITNVPLLIWSLPIVFFVIYFMLKPYGPMHKPE